jgi:hypothetical protein
VTHIDVQMQALAEPASRLRSLQHEFDAMGNVVRDYHEAVSDCRYQSPRTRSRIPAGGKPRQPGGRPPQRSRSRESERGDHAVAAAEHHGGDHPGTGPATDRSALGGDLAGRGGGRFRAHQEELPKLLGQLANRYEEVARALGGYVPRTRRGAADGPHRPPSGPERRRATSRGRRARSSGSPAHPASATSSR